MQITITLMPRDSQIVVISGAVGITGRQHHRHTNLTGIVDAELIDDSTGRRSLIFRLLGSLLVER